MQNISKILSINKFTLLCSILLLSFHASYATIEFPISKPEVDSLKKSEEKLWYVDGPIKKQVEKKPKQESKQTQAPPNFENLGKVISAIGFIFQILVWVILGAAILGAIYVIFNNLKGFKFKPNATLKVTNEKIIEEPDVKDIVNIDFSTQIEKCIQEKNYRLATRYYYLWIMKNLNEANLIAFNIDKTNQDYVQELRKKTTFGKEKLTHFMQCTNYYEYLWFGNFAVSESNFAQIENTFKAFINKKA